MKVHSGVSSQVKHTSQTSGTQSNPPRKEETVARGTPEHRKPADGFSTGPTRKGLALFGNQPSPPEVNVHVKVGNVASGGRVTGVEAGSVSNALINVRLDVASNRGEVLGAQIKGDVRNSTLHLEHHIDGENTGSAESARIGGNVTDSVIVANGKVTIDGNVSGSIIVVDKPSDLVVKGKLSPDTRVMTPAEFEKYQREHPLPQVGTH